jgi:hypothetical protein
MREDKRGIPRRVQRLLGHYLRVLLRQNKG